MIALDDNIEDHPKFAGLSNDAFALWVRCVGYCRRNVTDGFVPGPAALARARTASAKKAIAELLKVSPGCSNPLWREVDGGYQIHDYLEWNPSKEQVEQKLAALREKGRRGGLRSGAARSKPEPETNQRAEAEPKQAASGLVQAEPKQHGEAEPKQPASGLVEPKRTPVRSGPVRSDPDLAKAGSSGCAVTYQAQDTSQHTHPPQPTAHDQGRQARILAELRRHPSLADVADEEFSAVLDGRAFHAGRSLEAVLEAIAEAAADIAPGTLAAVVRQRVRQYADRAGRSRGTRAALADPAPTTPCPASSDASTGAWLAEQGLPALASAEGAEVGRMLDHYAGLGERRVSWPATWAKWRSSPHPKTPGPHPTIVAARHREELRDSAEVAAPTLDPGATKALIGGVLAALGGGA
jgi:hypothetical protein